MIRGLESILIGSENAEKLAHFYREVVGLKQTDEFEFGEDNAKGFMFDTGKVGFGIMDHSQVKGKNKNPERIFFNLEVDDIEQEVKRLKEAKVKVQQDIYHVEGYGLIATFVDPDGNFFQFVQVRANN